MGVGAFCGALLGCPNPNTYGTPRTVPAGQGQHTIAAEAIYVSSRSGGDGSPRETEGLPMFPTYQYRHGLTDTLDIGARAPNLSGLGVDLKWNFVRGRFDLAIDPGAQWAYVPVGDGFHVFYLHAPLLAGFNVTRRVTIVLTPGAVFAVEAGKPPPVRHTLITQGSSVLGRLGVGLNLRLGRHFALMPEVTAMRAFNDTAGVVVVGGIGIKLGAQPLMDGETTEVPPARVRPVAPLPAPVPAPAPAPLPAPLPAPE